MDVGEENGASRILSNVHMIKENVFVLLKLVKTNEVALIRSHKNQFILAKESKDSGVVLGALIAGLYGKGNVLVIAEPEAHDRMTDISARPRW